MLQPSPQPELRTAGVRGIFIRVRAILPTMRERGERRAIRDVRRETLVLYDVGDRW